MQFFCLIFRLHFLVMCVCNFNSSPDSPLNLPYHHKSYYLLRSWIDVASVSDPLRNFKGKDLGQLCNNPDQIYHNLRICIETLVIIRISTRCNKQIIR